MHSKVFQKYKNKLLFLNIISWVSLVPTFIQNEFLLKITNIYLGLNKKQIKPFKFFLFFVWVVTSLIAKIATQLTLYVYLGSFLFYFDPVKKVSNASPLVRLFTTAQLYSPTRVIFTKYNNNWLVNNFVFLIFTGVLLIVIASYLC